MDCENDDSIMTSNTNHINNNNNNSNEDDLLDKPLNSNEDDLLDDPLVAKVTGVPKKLTDEELEEKETQITKLINSLNEPRNKDRKDEYVEKVILTIAELLRLKEAEEAAEKLVEEDDEEENIILGKQKKEEKEIQDDPEKKTLCACCHQAASTMCVGCNMVYYCDKECQKKHWKMHKEKCKSFNIMKTNKDHGRVLQAARNLKKDCVIIEETPVAVGPRPGNGAVCLNCYKQVEMTYRCKKCNLPLCSAKCEGEPPHSINECEIASSQFAKEIFQKDLPLRFFDAILPLRCLISSRRETSRWALVADRANSKLAETASTTTASKDLKDIIMNKFKIQMLPEFRKVLDADIVKAIGICQVRSIPLKIKHGEVNAIFTIASLLQHSCVPNTKLLFDNHTHHLKATTAAPMAKNTVLSTIFTDVLWGTRARREHLLTSKFEACNCIRCTDPTELGSYFSALICRKCSNRAPVVSTDPVNITAPWRCKNCSFQMRPEEVLDLTFKLGSAVATELDETPSIESMEALQNEWIPKFHANHYHLQAIKHTLLQMYGREEEKKENKSEKHWKEIALKEKACKEFLCLCSRIDPAMACTMPFVGLTFFEYHKTILQNAKRNYGLAKISTLQLKKRMLLAKELLRKAMDIFKGEQNDTPEGQLFLTCQYEFMAIAKWMLAVGLV